MKKRMIICSGLRKFMSASEDDWAVGFIKYLRELFVDLYDVEECIPMPTCSDPVGAQVPHVWSEKSVEPCDVFVGAFQCRPPCRLDIDLAHPDRSCQVPVLVLCCFVPLDPRPDLSNICISLPSGKNTYSAQQWIFGDYESGACIVNEFLQEQNLPFLD